MTSPAHPSATPADGGLRVTVLGASGTFAGPGGAASGYLVRGGETTLWLDAGPGTLGALQQHVELADLDAVLLTHSHPDHWLELPVLRNALRYVLGIEGLAVFGTEDTRRLAETVVGGDLAPTFRWTTIAGGTRFAVGDLEVSTSTTDHPVETHAVRIDHDGRSLGYSADTGPAWSASELGPGLDLLLCEASLADHDEDASPHLSGRQAGALAAAAGVGRLVLTHVVPGVDPESQRASARLSFDGPVELAVAGATFAV